MRERHGTSPEIGVLMQQAPPPSPARARLAAAIADLTRLGKERDALHAADMPSLYAVTAAEDALTAATEALHVAARREVDHRIDGLADADTVDVLSVDDARRTAEIAERDLQVARQARAEIQRRSQENAEAISRGQFRVKDAAQAVVLDETTPLIHRLAQDLEAAQQKLAEAGIALTFLRRMQPHRWSQDPPAAFADLSGVLFRLDQPPAMWDIAQQVEASPVAMRLADWLDQLMTNASAAMPQ